MKRIIIFGLCCAVFGIGYAEQVIRTAQTNTTYGHIALSADGTTLTAVPNDGYEFIAWEDNSTETTRTVSPAASMAGATPMYAIFARTEDIRHNEGDVQISLTNGATGAMSFSIEQCDDYSPFTAWSNENHAISIAYTESMGRIYPIFKQSTEEVTSHERGTISVTKVECGYQLTATPVAPYVFAGWQDDPTAPATRIVSLAAATYQAEFSEVLNLIIDSEGLPSFTNGAFANVTLQRPLSADSYSTICLPFDMALSEFGVACEAYALTGSSMDNGMLVVSFNTPVETLEAGKPYLIKPASATSSNIVLASPKRLSNTTTNASSDYVDFMAALNPTELSNDGNTLFLGANDLLYRPATTDNMPGLRGYFTTHDLVVNVPMRLAINERQIATSIDKVPNAQAITKFIRNNQMVIRVRDVEYNAQGAIIR